MLRRWRREAQYFEAIVALALPAMARGAQPEAIASLLQLFQWKFIAKGGDTRPGRIGNLDHCPCQEEYTVATAQSVFGARPNQAQINAACANPPEPAPAEWPCTGDCFQVRTHVWHGWLLLQNLKTKQFVLNCSTFAQYHCKRPSDPDREKPPEQGPPRLEA